MPAQRDAMKAMAAETGKMFLEETMGIVGRKICRRAHASDTQA